MKIIHKYPPVWLKSVKVFQLKNVSLWRSKFMLFYGCFLNLNHYLRDKYIIVVNNSIT